MKTSFLIRLSTLAILMCSTFQVHSLELQAKAPSEFIIYQVKKSVENEDIMNLYRFHDIQVAKLNFSGVGLIGKNYRLFVQEIKAGKPLPRVQLFDSREDEYFKIKDQELNFSVLAKHIAGKKVRFDFRFLGFGLTREFPVKTHYGEFALQIPENTGEFNSLPLSKPIYVLNFTQPQTETASKKRYANFDPSLTDPLELGKIKRIPTYFLISIEFSE
ncbi:hypothetical protein RF679_09330 [Undibacterium cyanobacteriorum]|uniref:Uncharacterized protein n=1 Tax=Undibacterium cyanobacteriorum TaxID=3073561 RepID=A0ABY9RMN2_9BURK|nr:hypothetical protein [Undibacterium sp. 20NA77.5]WMW82461.1 hypothetical protein RF679_09330 [Undibacterium sp. 20NA77.5]